MPAVKKRRRKKKRYHTGIHHSPKCATPIHYRSGWELVVCHFLDSNPYVLEYGYECLTIPYVSNVRTGKTRLYYPDFLVTFRDGSKSLVEVKRKDKLSDPLVVKKAKAAEAWCESQKGVRYEIWTNQVIEGLKKVLLASRPNLLSPTKKPKAKRSPRRATSSKR